MKTILIAILIQTAPADTIKPEEIGLIAASALDILSTVSVYTPTNGTYEWNAVLRPILKKGEAQFVVVASALTIATVLVARKSSEDRPRLTRTILRILTVAHLAAAANNMRIKVKIGGD